jgi:hypothetical protein
LYNKPIGTKNRGKMMVIKDLITGKFVKIIGMGPTAETLRILFSDGTVKIQLRKLLELVSNNKTIVK